jgi:hypothetical protein
MFLCIFAPAGFPSLSSSFWVLILIFCPCRLLLMLYCISDSLLFGLVPVSLLLCVLVSNLRSILFYVNLLLFSLALSSCLSLFFSYCLSMSFASCLFLYLSCCLSLPLPTACPCPLTACPCPLFLNLSPLQFQRYLLLAFYILPVLSLVLPVFPLNFRPALSLWGLPLSCTSGLPFLYLCLSRFF